MGKFGAGSERKRCGVVRRCEGRAKPSSSPSSLREAEAPPPSPPPAITIEHLFVGSIGADSANTREAGFFEAG
jgi:hypothetical protein